MATPTIFLLGVQMKSGKEMLAAVPAYASVITLGLMGFVIVGSWAINTVRSRIVFQK